MTNIQPAEEWKLLQECPEYEISSLGRIKRIESGFIITEQDSSIRLKWKSKFVLNRKKALYKYFPEKLTLLHPDLEGEEWRPIEGFEGFYLVSNKGRVKTIPHNVTRSNGRPHYVNEKILSLRKRGNIHKKYYVVRLYKSDSDHNMSVHRLVATAFVPNPLNLPVVNHKDGDPLNNNAYNLEWGTQEYNIEYADKVTRSFEFKKTRVVIMDLGGREITTADSIKEAASIIKGHRICIRNVCENKQTQHKGYKFRYG